MTTQEQDIVNRVAELVSTFFSLQNISGENDYLPHAIACALRQGYIRCPGCLSTGKALRDGGKCTQCKGNGKIDFSI